MMVLFIFSMPSTLFLCQAPSTSSIIFQLIFSLPANLYFSNDVPAHLLRQQTSTSSMMFLLILTMSATLYLLHNVHAHLFEVKHPTHPDTGTQQPAVVTPPPASSNPPLLLHPPHPTHPRTRTQQPAVVTPPTPPPSDPHPATRRCYSTHIRTQQPAVLTPPTPPSTQIHRSTHAPTQRATEGNGRKHAVRYQRASKKKNPSQRIRA